MQFGDFTEVELFVPLSPQLSLDTHWPCVCVCFTCVTDVCIRSVCSNILCYSHGLAMEYVEANKLLWKSRPKHHKLLGSKVAMMIHNTSPVKYDLSRFLLLYDHFLSKARPSGLRCCSPDQSHQTQLLHGRRRGWKIEKISDGQQPPKHGRNPSWLWGGDPPSRTFLHL